MKGKKNSGFLVAVTVGSVSSVIVSALGCLISAWLLNSQKVEEVIIPYMVMGITAGSVIIGAFFAASGVDNKILPVCAATAAVYLLLLVGGNLLFLDGCLNGFLPTMLLILGCGVFTALVYTKVTEKGRRKKRPNC